MADLNFRKMQLGDETTITEFIKYLYKEDAGSSTQISDDKIVLTFQMLSDRPDYGTLFVIEYDSSKEKVLLRQRLRQRQRVPIGYSLVINFWSNEYGGIIGNIDELYIMPKYRSRGIGTRFIKWLRSSSQSNHLVALELQVLPYNTRALKLYESLGFDKSDRNHYLLDINKQL
jgi:ribosomal protein S18 acetylase RimI-like enzyme